MTELHDDLRAWARGDYPTEAAVELLIRHGRFVYDGAPWIMRRLGAGGVPAGRSIDAASLLSDTAAYSGGERRVAAIAASLLDRHDVTLSDVLPGLDRPTLDLVLAAFAHAGGSHEHSVLTYDDAGNPSGFAAATTLHPWPATDSSAGRS